MRRLLLLSASIISIAVAQTPAHAQGTPPATGWYFSAEGGPVFSNAQVYDSPDYVVRNDAGMRAALAFGRRFDPALDWRVALAWTKFRDGSASDGSTEMSSSLEYGTADLEIGRNWTAANDPLLALRAFAGVRALYARDSVDKVGGSNNHRESNYLGIGPRAGFNFEKRVAESPWGISGGAAGAAVIGTRNTTDKTGVLPPSTETALTFDAALGLDYHTGPNSKITAGVRGEQVWNLRPLYDDIETRRDVLSWGPFVKFEVKM